MKDTQIFMDYKKVYDLFSGDSNKDINYNQKISDQKFEVDIMKKDFLSDVWFNVPFILIAAGHFEVGDRHYTKRTKRNYYEIIYTVSGQGQVYINGKNVECLPNTVLLIDCNIPHVFSVKKGEKWEYKHIHFIANGVAKNIAERAMFDIFVDNGAVNDLFVDIFKKLHHINADTHYLLSHDVSAILTNLIRMQAEYSFANPQEELVKRAAEYIHKHYMEKISINDLAKSGFISPYHFIRLFKKYYGVPPYNYLVEYRLKKAQHFFMQQKSVKEVARACGFSSTNSLSRAFEKHFGVYPSEYRDAIQKVDPAVDLIEIDKEN